MIRITSGSNREVAIDCQTARPLMARRRLSVAAVAVSLALTSVIQIMPAYAADPAPQATPPTAQGNKQIAAIDFQKAKDAAASAGVPPATVSAPSSQTVVPPATAAGTVPVVTPGSAPVTPVTTGSTTAATSAAGVDSASGEPAPPKMLLKPGQPLIVVPIETEDVQPTDDVNLAREQALHFPDSAEAAFILAVALTRTSRVEEALQQVRVARKLAQAQGGPAYFDKMIKSYEEMLQSVDDPRVHYSLAWAYYMKAYLLAQDSRKALGNPQIQAAASIPTPAGLTPAAASAAGVSPAGTTPAAATAPGAMSAGVTSATPAVPAPPAVSAVPQNTSVPNTMSAKAERKKVDSNMAMMLLQGLNPDIAAKMQQQNGRMPASQLPTIPTAIQKAAPSAVPQIHLYYTEALKNLDAVLAKKPDDVWALLYKWHLYAEETGNLSESMKQWREAERRFPTNPGVQFFLGEGYLKEGNLKEAIFHASKAVFLRGAGN